MDDEVRNIINGINREIERRGITRRDFAKELNQWLGRYKKKINKSRMVSIHRWLSFGTQPQKPTLKAMQKWKQKI